MVKKFLVMVSGVEFKVAFFGFMAAAVLASAIAKADHYGMAGCGLGALVFDDKPGKIQIVASTLNNIISPQTSALSSGTSNCTEDNGRESAAKFIDTNKEALKKDISKGKGETLTGLLHIWGCTDVETLGSTLQGRYNSIFPKSNVTSKEVNQSIESTIQVKGLSKSCRTLS